MDEATGDESPPAPGPLVPGDPLAPLTRWLAAGRVDEAARARARQRWLERQAREEATLGGVLLDLAERSRPVLLSTAAGRSFRGLVRVVGADFVVIQDEGLGEVIIPSRSLAVVRPAAGDDGVGGERPFTVELVLGETLVELAADNPMVLVAAGQDQLRGELRSAGIDVLEIALDSSRREVVHVTVATVDHLAILSR